MDNSINKHIKKWMTDRGSFGTMESEETWFDNISGADDVRDDDEKIQEED